MTAARKKTVARPAKRRRYVILKDGRRIYFPTEPSVIGEDRIERAVKAVILGRSKG